MVQIRELYTLKCTVHIATSHSPHLVRHLPSVVTNKDMIWHTLERNFTSVHTATSREIHEVTRTGETLHRCRYCNLSFTTYSTRTTHEITHTGKEKLHKCRHCDMSCNTYSNKARHEMTHIGEKLHKCRYCDKSYNYTSHLLITFTRADKSGTDSTRRTWEQSRSDVTPKLEMRPTLYYYLSSYDVCSVDTLMSS